VAGQGERIRLARQRVGINQRELAQLAGVSQPTISRVESGEHPGLTVTELHRIAVATGTTVAALLRETPGAGRLLSAARLAAGAAVGAESTAASVAAELLELDATLDALAVPGRQERRRPEAEFDRKDGPSEQGRTAAAGIRAALGAGVGPLADIDESIEQLTGVDVVHRELGGVSGFCAVDPDRGTAIVLVGTGAAETAERQRFTAAHELAHLMFPGDPRHQVSAGRPRPPEEVRADTFARHLLIPADGVRSWLLANDVTTVTEAEWAALANVYRVSPEVVLIQLRELGRAPAGLDGPPTGRRLAYRHGWGPAYDLAQAAARADRPAVRLVDRATRAYRQGKLGLPPLAKLLGMSVNDARAALADAGVVPPRRDDDAAVDAAISGHLMAGLSPTAADRRMARRIVDGDEAADRSIRRSAERLGISTTGE